MHSIRTLLSKRSESERRIVKNTAWLSAAEVGSRVARSVLAIISARILGAEGLGVWAYAIALGGFLTFFEDAGIATFVTREFSKDASDKHSVFYTAFVLKICLLGFAALAFMLAGPHMSSIAAARPIIPIVALVIIFDSLRGFFFSISRAQQKMHIESLIQIGTNILVAVFGVLFLAVSPTPYALALGYAVGGGIGCLAIFLLVKKHLFTSEGAFSKKLLVRIFDAAWPFTILAISNIAIFNVDTLLLGHYSTTTAVGWYSAASKVVQLLFIVPSLFGTVMFPVLVQKANAAHNLSAAIRKTFIFLTTLAAVLVVAMNVSAHLVVGLAFGPAFLPAAGIICILSFSYIPVFIGGALTSAILAIEQQKKFVVANIAGVLINVPLNMLLIPHYGATGAAISTVISLSVITLVSAVQFKKITQDHPQFS